MLYHISAKKGKKYIAYIDSINIKDETGIQLPDYKTDNPGTIVGSSEYSDTIGMEDKRIMVYCKEIKSYMAEIIHGEQFTFPDLPKGYYTIYCFLPSEKAVDIA